MIIKVLQLSGNSFPIGGFSHSYGLETYVTEEAITSVTELFVFIKSMLFSVISDCDGPAVCLAHNLASSNDLDGLLELDEFFTALKLSRENREAQSKMGRAFLRMALKMYPDNDFLFDYHEHSRKENENYPVAFGAVSAQVGIEKELATTAYIFSAVNSIVQAGIKLIPLGPSESQRLIVELYQHIIVAVKASCGKTFDEIGSFSPGLDLASMRHEKLYTRLYMS